MGFLEAILDFFKYIWNSFVVLFFSSGNWFFVIVDIAIVSFIVYKIIQFMRQTRAEQLIKGIFIFFLAYFFANLLHLNALKWMVSIVTVNFLVVIVVLFQPELRGILEKLGKTGALIIIERTTMLNDIANTGTIIDAKCSVNLINNIFFKNSPLHDGAMIIRNHRVYATSCILPLTQNLDIESELGTRHRAAIGLSEISDAIVVVVSEETGKISIAIGGKLQRNFTKDMLKAELVDQLVDSAEKAPESKFIKLFVKKGGNDDEKN